MSVIELKLHSKTTQLRRAISSEMSIEELAEKTNLSPGTVKRYLDSDYNNIPTAGRETIENALSKKPEYMTDQEQLDQILDAVDRELHLYKDDLTFFSNLIKLTKDNGTAAQITKAEILNAANMANSSIDMAIMMLNDLNHRTKDDPFLKVTVMKELAYTHYSAKHIEECDLVLKKAIRMSMDHNLGDLMLGKLHHMNGLNRHKGEKYEAAEKSFRLAEKYYSADRPIEQCRMRILIGLCQVKTDKRKANRTLVGALKKANELNHDGLFAMVYNSLFDCNYENIAYAELYAKKAVEHALNSGFHTSIAVSRFNLARYHLRYDTEPALVESVLSDTWAFERLTLAHIEESLENLIIELVRHKDGEHYLKLLESAIEELLKTSSNEAEKRKYKEIFGHIYFKFNELKGRLI